MVGCNGTADQSSKRAGADLAEARHGFQTKLKSRGPAPQDYENATPPNGVREIHYESGDLKLKAWLSEVPDEGKIRPAVVYLHGGWSFAPIDWQDAAPFVDAGFVLMMPMLRAENGNPGFYEGFYGEVDDVTAAGQFVSALPYVDPDNVFVAGHSVGAVLTVLAAMVPSAYRAGAALSLPNQCDHVRSPLLRLAPTSTLSLWTNFNIEGFCAGCTPPSWYDRASAT